MLMTTSLDASLRKSSSPFGPDLCHTCGFGYVTEQCSSHSASTCFRT